MNDRTAKRLLDALTACRQIEAITSGFDLQAYLHDEVVRLASERLLEVVGEALNVASRDEPELLNSIPDIAFAVGLRNKIAHDYDDISNEIIWDTITHDIPAMRLQIEVVMENAPPL